MRTVADSEPFKAFDLADSALSSGIGRQKEVGNYDEKINQAVDSILTQQIALLEDKTTDKIQLGDKIELVYDPNLPLEGLKETELQKEQQKKYR